MQQAGQQHHEESAFLFFSFLLLPLSHVGEQHDMNKYMQVHSLHATRSHQLPASSICSSFQKKNQPILDHLSTRHATLNHDNTSQWPRKPSTHHYLHSPTTPQNMKMMKKTIRNPPHPIPFLPSPPFTPFLTSSLRSYPSHLPIYPFTSNPTSDKRTPYSVITSQSYK
jgi:hypothetical protein